MLMQVLAITYLSETRKQQAWLTFVVKVIITPAYSIAAAGFTHACILGLVVLAYSRGPSWMPQGTLFL
jgi:hypothetical protein